MKQEESVYLMAMIGVAIWIVGFMLGAFLTFSEPVMIGINVIIIGAVLVLHILQYMHTKQWETRLLKSQRHARHA
jgi:hydrogenase-4 membrane subunit HyfE